MNRSLKASAHTSEAMEDRCTHQTRECLSDVDRETTQVRASYLSKVSDRPHRLHLRNRSSLQCQQLILISDPDSLNSFGSATAFRIIRSKSSSLSLDVMAAGEVGKILRKIRH